MDALSPSASSDARLPPEDALLATKLFIPPPRQNLVSRPRLLERLDQGLAARLIVLCGPGGSGKTTLLGEWLSRGGHRAAWLSLEEGDGSVPRFLAYLIAALRTALPGVGARSLALLRAESFPSAEGLLALLINEIAAQCVDEPPLILVLDDYHTIESVAVHHALAYLLEHLPPMMHLVVAARADPPLPLARLRARGQLIEIRSSDLRFTPQETAALVASVTRFDLSPDAVATLDARAEGWAAGLQMAALSLQGRPREDLGEAIASFSGSSRHIADYMVDEVLSRQPAEIQAFLMRTAVLERLSGPLCEAVVGQTGGQATLEYLDRANLFVTPLDDGRRWYRYHHLFADLLRARLDELEPGLAVTLHGRASDWYERNGLAHEAVHHALAAGDIQRAVRLIEGQAESVLTWGEYATLVAWVESLPWEVARRRGWLCVCCGWCLVWLGRGSEVERWLGAADAVAHESPGTPAGDRVAGGAAAVRARRAYQQGDPDTTLAQGALALRHLPQDGHLFRVAAAHMVGDACFDRGNLAAAEEAWLEEMRTAERHGEAGLTIYPLRALAMLYRERGALRRAEEACRLALRLAGERSAGHWWHGRLCAALGEILWERGERDEALRVLRDGVAHDEAWSETQAMPGTYASLAEALRADGDLAGAEAALATAERLVRATSQPPRIRSQVEVARVRLWLSQGRTDLAERWALGWQARAAPVPALMQEAEEVACARVLLSLGRHAKARALLGTLEATSARTGRTGRLVETLALTALARRLAGDLVGAVEDIERALALAEPEGRVRVFADEGVPMAALLAQARRASPAQVACILAAMRGSEGPGRPRAGTTLAEPLSTREQEVLDLLARGLTNQEIAGRLVITVSTVKSHTASIYGKLAVKSRREAVARARGLGILS